MNLHDALFQEKVPGAVQCRLCPRHCLIPDGKAGFCGVRFNLNGSLKAVTYGLPAAIQIDPIEKKPLHHFLQGSRTFSIGTFGCNLGCCFCQNSDLSRGTYSPGQEYRYFSPAEIADKAALHGCESVALTYNEPAVFIEYAHDIAEEAHKLGLKTVLVSNGFITQEAADYLYPLIDAANIDIKGFSEAFYQEMCSASLEPVLKSCMTLKKYGAHLEITNLVIPGKNDSMEMINGLLDWVQKNPGVETPVHFTAYHPAYKFTAAPPTPPQLLAGIRKYAIQRGFQAIHLGNVPIQFLE